MSQTASIEELRTRIDEQAERLTNLVNSDENKRIRKRILQSLGKLKKQLASVTEGSQAVQSSPIVKFNAPLSNKKAKLKLKIVNGEISEFALKKQLKLARKRFEWLGRHGIVPGKFTHVVYCSANIIIDVHTYTNLLNAYVRCRDISGAISTWRTMLAANITPNVVTYTTLIRGFCEVAQIERAKELLVKMLAGSNNHDLIVHPPPAPNVRTLNAFFRGCIRVGAVDAAMEVFTSNAASSDPITLDESSFEYMAVLLCQSMYLQQALQLATRFIAEFSTPVPVQTALTESMGPIGGALAREEVLIALAGREIRPDAMLHAAAIFLCIARTHSLSGNFAASASFLHTTRVCLQACKSSSVRHAMLLRLESGGLGVGDSKSKSGGSGGAASSASVGLFMQHRNSELTRDCTFVEKYNSRWDVCLSNATEDSTGSDRTRELHLLAMMSRTLLFFALHPAADDTRETRHDQVVTNMLAYSGESFGLNRLATLMGKSDKVSVMQSIMRSIVTDGNGLYISFTNVLGGYAASEPSTRIKRKVKGDSGNGTGGASKRSRRDLSESSLFLDLASDLPTVAAGGHGDAAQAENEEGDVEVRMEICSGTGEWIVEQARAHAERNKKSSHKVLYVALELRADRVHHTMSQAVLRETTSNLAVIGGDASLVLPMLIRPNSVSIIFINHPEPPERRSGGEDMSQGNHLLTESFFKEMHRVLRPNGKLTIVTDNRLYAHALAKSISCLNREGRDSEKHQDYFSCHASRDYQEDSAPAVGKLHPLYVQRVETLSSESEDDSSHDGASCENPLKAQKDRLAVVKGDGGGSTTSEQRDCAITVHPGDPGGEGGHVDVEENSSYFSRMWKHGNKARVWHLILTKVSEHREEYSLL